MMGQAINKICLNAENHKNQNLPPYHVFKRLDAYFVFDTSACRFYKIDELSYEFLKLCLSCSIDEVAKKLCDEGKFPTEKISRTAQEITILANNGLFDIPDYSANDDHMKKDLDRTYSKPVHSVELALAETCNLACKYSRNLPLIFLIH